MGLDESRLFTLELARESPGVVVWWKGGGENEQNRSFWRGKKKVGKNPKVLRSLAQQIREHTHTHTRYLRQFR